MRSGSPAGGRAGRGGSRGQSPAPAPDPRASPSGSPDPGSPGPFPLGPIPPDQLFEAWPQGPGPWGAPLLVPLVQGAATNFSLGESYGDAEAALIERYLALMSPAAHARALQAGAWGRGQAWAQPGGGQGQGQAASWGGGNGGGGDGGAGGVLDLAGVVRSESPARAEGVEERRRSGAGGGAHAPPPRLARGPPSLSLHPGDGTSALAPGADPTTAPALPPSPPSALRLLGLDRETLAARRVPPALASALHRGLAAAAAAFFRSCLAERRRLAALTAGSGPAVPLADRLLAFVTGTEHHLALGSSLPDVDEVREARDVQELLDAVALPLSPPPPFDMGPPSSQGLGRGAGVRWATDPAPGQGQGPDLGGGAAPEHSFAFATPPSSAPPPAQRQAAAPAPRPAPPYHHELAHLRALQGPAAPAAPAPPGPPDGAALTGVDPLSAEELEDLMDWGQVTSLASAGNVTALRGLLRGLLGAYEDSRRRLGQRAEAEGARAQREWERAAEARREAEALRDALAERNRVVSKRGEQLEAACVRAAAAEEALAAERAVAGGLRGQLRGLAAEYQAAQNEMRTAFEAQIAELKQLLPQGEDPHGVHRLEGQLAEARSGAALAAMSLAQERGVSGQLRVMLASVRGTVGEHAARAAAAAGEAERLRRLVAASQDLANATSGGVTMLTQQLAQERAAHRRTAERLAGVGWRVEQARTAVVDIRARAAHGLRRLQLALGKENLRALTAEGQCAAASQELRTTARQLEDTRNALEALRDRSVRLEAEAAARDKELVAARLSGGEAAGALRAAQAALGVAEARVAQMQQKVMDDAQAVLAGKAASARLEELDKDHAELQSSHASLQSAHAALAAAHRELTSCLGAMRERVTELERRDALLTDLLVRHDALSSDHARLQGVHEALSKEHQETTAALNTLRRHCEALAEQIQEYRTLSERTAAALEAERDAHRHTQAELDLTAAARDELQTQCTGLQGRVDELESTTAAAQAETARCRRAVELAEQQRAEAFAMRDAWTRARLLIASDVREYLASVAEQVARLEGCLEAARGPLQGLQSRLLDLGPGALEGSGVRGPELGFEEAQQVVSALHLLVAHGGELLATQGAVRAALVAKLEAVEEGLPQRLAATTDYWRQVLVLTRGSPRAMIQMVERMTGQVVKELELDPATPLGRMVPLGVLEEAGVELSSQQERLGGLEASARSAAAARQAAEGLLAHEREVAASRAAEYRTIIEQLTAQLSSLRARAGSLEAAAALQARATADMQRMLTDAEWKVSKAQEREALAGIRFMVPLGRSDRAVQTLAADTTLSGGGGGVGWGGGVWEGEGEAGAQSWPGEGVGALPASPASLPPLSSLGSPMGPGPLSPRGGALRPSSAAGAGPGPGGGGGGGPSSPSASGGAAAASPGPRPGSNLIRASHPLPLSSLSLPGRHPSPGPGPGAGAEGAAGLLAGEGSAGPEALVGSLDEAAAAAAVVLRRQVSRGGSVRPLSAMQGAGAGAGGQGPPPPLGAGVGALAAAAAALSQRSRSNPNSPRGAAPLQPLALAAALQPGVGAGAGGQQRRRHPDQVGPGAAWQSPTASASGAAAAGVGPTQTQQRRPGSAEQISAGGGVGAGAWGPDEGSGGEGEWNPYGEYDQGTGWGEDTGAGEDEPLSPPPALRTPSVTATAASAAAYAGSRPGSALPANRLTSGPASAASSRPTTAGRHRLSPAPRASSPQPLGPPPPPPPPAPTPSGIPHGWQTTPWDWLPDVLPYTRGAVPYSRQALLELITDVQQTKALHDQVAAAAAFPPTPLAAYLGAYFEARHGPRGGSPAAAEPALAQLLASLEAHSALYEVVLFARAAGLQAWTSKAPHRNGSLRPASSRPGTASTSTSAPNSPANGPGRPRTSRPALSALAALNGGAGPGPGGGPMSPRSAAAGGGAAAARSNRIASARVAFSSFSGPVGGPGGAPGSPLSRTEGGEALGGGTSTGGGEGPGGETTLRVRTGTAPSVSVSLSGGGGAAPPPPPPPPPPLPRPGPKLRLALQPGSLLGEGAGAALAGLGGVGGMEALAGFVAGGRLLARLRPSDLGQQLFDETAPALHWAVAQAVAALALPELPEIRERPGLPHGADVMLLQLPSVAVTQLSVLGAGDPDRPPAAASGSAAAGVPGGWRRRALLLVSPALAEAAEAAAAAAKGSGGGWSLGLDEVVGALGAALAPMAMPGGYGWRMDLEAGGLQGAGAGAGAGGGGGPPASPPLLSAAEVLTAVAVADLKPRAAFAALPSQLQVKWERLLAHLRAVAGQVAAAGDRGALAAAQQLGPALTAVYRHAAGVGAAEPGAGAAGGGGGEGGVGSAEELLLQAQALPWSEVEVAAMACRPLAELAAGAGGPEARRAHGLARVALLGRWAESAEYRNLLRASARP
ncbi:hypothetical protein HYH03_009873 [Edaphochlamys debaryana]|uniref:Uncharacterized protein n=1 Tax=Edaphochlamys debaryana TaxID=47281 RepID=A0A836BWP0_9CHLO|nr:hypothetical protein HYH03_009873 [Edaphochlamys debaryana]|eukprot:KAG2491710.1 hypothetical protein HYH03_009873 [Edaphochlamys debaryana]